MGAEDNSGMNTAHGTFPPTCEKKLEISGTSFIELKALQLGRDLGHPDLILYCTSLFPWQFLPLNSKLLQGRGRILFTLSTRHLQGPMMVDYRRLSRNAHQTNILNLITGSSLLKELALEHGLAGPWWLSGQELACRCRRCGFDPWVGKIPWRKA